MKSDHRSKFSNFSNWKEEAWKKQGFNGIWTRELRDTGAILYQLSYEAAHWERGQFIEDDVRTGLTSLPMCSFIAQLVEHRTGIRGGHGFESRWSPDFFQASTFQLLKLENLLRWSLFTFVSYRSTNMNYFIYISHDFTAREEMNSINWPCSQCVAS